MNKYLAPAIEAVELTKCYENLPAVNQASFEVKEGEIFGFLGPNGAGKTTTINMLTGLARPTSGSIFIFGRDYTRDIKKAQRLMGIVPDESNLYPELDGLANLHFCAALYGMEKSKREKKAKELLELFGLSNTGKKKFAQYSRGMKRKLTIAAGIIHMPRILFLDEPTTGLDVASARQIRRLLLQLNKEGRTIFLTTHYIEEAERLCDRIAFIVEGKIVEVGKVTNLMRDFQEKKTIQFSVADTVPGLIKELRNTFPAVECKQATGDTIRVHSLERINLAPFIRFFEDHGIEVTEARKIRPTLEDVFVRVTGIEVDTLHMEKEKGAQKI